jgi:Rod binding domain-containing protein
MTSLTSPVLPSPALPAPTSTGTALPMGRARHAAEAFTAVAIGEMLSPMFATLDDTGGSFGGGAGEAAFRPMLIEQMATGIAHQGGFGITDQVAQAMLRLQESKE